MSAKDLIPASNESHIEALRRKTRERIERQKREAAERESEVEYTPTPHSVAWLDEDSP